MTVTVDSLTSAPIPSILTQRLGVWTVLTTSPTPRPFNRDIHKSIAPTYRAVRQNLHDVYSLAPGLLGMYVLISLWESIEGALYLYLSSRILLVVSCLTFTHKIGFPLSDVLIPWCR